MASLNSVHLIGRVGRDPELKHSTIGNAICNFSIATSESWKDKNTGEKKEQTEWHRIVAYRKLAEVIGQYVKKGSMLYLEGKITYREWTDKDGVKRTTTEIVADEIQFLDSKPKSSQENYRPPETPRSGPVNHDDDDSFIPF